MRPEAARSLFVSLQSGISELFSGDRLRKIGLAFLMLSVLAACSPGVFVEPDVEQQPAPFDGALDSSEIMKEASSTDQVIEVNFQDYGLAPEIHEGIWLNTEEPLKLADLRGKVVLLEMWTFGCINCKHVIPSLKEWHDQYANQGLVVIGNHYPEFAFERDLDNLKQAVADLGIEYPVLQDNDGETWRAYENRYWPALFLIDKRGFIRYRHIGEGAYAETEAAIQSLLAETIGE